MPNPLITGKIDVTKISRDHIFHGKKGKYVDFAIFANRDGPDQYGFTHVVVQSVSKEARERGERGPIIGNASLIATGTQAAPSRPPQQPRNNPPQPTPAADDIPF